MTQQINAPMTGREDTTVVGPDVRSAIPAQRAPLPPGTNTGYPPPPPGPAGPSPARIALAALVGVVVVLGALFGWLLLAPSTPSSAPPMPAVSGPAAPPIGSAPPISSAPPIGSPAPSASAPGPGSPATTAARQQTIGAIIDFNLAGNRFAQAVQKAKLSHDKGALKTAISDFRSATARFEAQVRAVPYPAAQQSIVDSRLLPTADRLRADLDQLAQFNPSTVGAAAQHAAADLHTTLDTSQEVLGAL